MLSTNYINTVLIFEFIDTTQESSIEVNKIKVGDITININLEKERIYKVKFSDLYKIDYKIYSCSFIFKTEKKDFGISIYFNRINYYYCIGKKINFNSIEIIFSDFSKYNQYLNNCSIIYDKKSYSVKEQLNEIKTRKRISFINIDMNKLVLPKIKKNRNDEINMEVEKYLLANYLISIEKGITDKIIGIYKNQPYSVEVNKKNIINLLQNIIEPSRKFLNYSDKYKSIDEYLKGINLKDSEVYRNSIHDSLKLDENKDIKKYFSRYLTSFDEEDIKIYKLCCEYLILFPDHPFKRKKSNLIPIKFFITQYYYSKKAITNLMNQIPKDITQEEKIRIELTAHKTIFSLLKKNKGLKNEELFDLIDLTKDGTIYFSAAQNNLKFIDSLKEESEIFPFLLQMNSGSSSNYLITNEPIFSARINMLTLEQIKKHLIASIPKFILRIKCFSDFHAVSFTETRMSAYSETDIFGSLVDLDPKNDKPLNLRFVLSNVMKHESFGHIKYSINDSSFQFDIPINLCLSKYQPSSPIAIYSPLNGEFILIYDSHSEKPKGESGYSLFYFLTRGEKLLYNFLENTIADFSELFENVDLMTSHDLTLFCDKLRQLAIQTGVYSDKDDNEEEEEKEEEKEINNNSSTGKYYLSSEKKKTYKYDGFSVNIKY